MTPSIPEPVALPPLPVPEPNPSLRKIARQRSPRPTVPSAALIPLFLAALLFLAGIVLAHYVYFRSSWLLLSLAPLAALAVVSILKSPPLAPIPIALLWLILGAWSAETEPEPAPDPAITQLSDGLLRTVEGTVTDAGPLRAPEPQDFPDPDSDRDPDAAEPPQGELLQRIDLQIATAEAVTDSADAMLPIPKSNSSQVRISVRWPSATATELQCGQRIRAVLRILPPDTFHDPGVWSRAFYLEDQRVTSIASLNPLRLDGNQPRLTLLGGSSSFPCLLNRMRDSASAPLQSLPTQTRALPRPLRATPEDAAMLTALLTGDRTYLTRSLRAGFERTGSFHLIVVSGLHLAILAGCVFALARRLRIPRLPATAITLAVALAYALFTGFGLPAQRSFWMIALYLAGRLLYRHRSPLNVIGFATLCLAAASPRSIFDASLQMTLLAVAAIAGIALPLLERTLQARIRATQDLRLIALDPRLPPRIAQFRVTVRLIARHLAPATSAIFAWRVFPFAIRSILCLGELLFVTLVVELALALPMAIYFHRITVYALPVNLIVLPLLTLLVPAAMLLLLTLAIWPVAAIVPATFTLAVLHFSLFVVRQLGSLALGDLRVPGPTQIQVAATILLFVLAILLARLPGWPRRLAFAALAAMTIAALWPRPIDHPANALLFEAIDVGQGDSLLLITPDGKTLLIDAGGLGFTGSPGQSSTHPIHSDFDVGEEVVSATLWSRGIRHLDAVALTHAHHDHMGGMSAILRNFRPRELWVGNNPPIPAYRDLLREAATLGTRVRSFHAGDTILFGAATLRVLAPAPGYRPGPEPANNDSLVLQAIYRSSSVLLAADAEAPEEQTILAESALHSTLLKVGHHGSRTSTRKPFLEAVDPQWAVISCGRRNRFGHPREEILAELQQAHVRTYRTDTEGATCFLLDGQSVSVQPDCGQHAGEGP